MQMFQRPETFLSPGCPSDWGDVVGMGRAVAHPAPWLPSADSSLSTAHVAAASHATPAAGLPLRNPSAPNQPHVRQQHSGTCLCLRRQQGEASEMRG